MAPRGDQIGWRHCDNLYFDPDRALGVAQRIAWEAGQPPIPLGKKGLGKRLDKLELLASKEPDRNTARPVIDGKKTDVWHIRSDRFYEFLERWDTYWESRRDEEALREHEEFLRRKEERERLAELRMRQAADFVQQGFSKLLDPGPAPDDGPPVQDREELPAEQPSHAQNGEGLPSTEESTPARGGEEPPTPEPREETTRPGREEGFLLD